MGERSTSLFRYPQHSIAMPFTSPTSLAPAVSITNPNRSPKRESQCDIVKVEPGVCGPEVLPSTNTNIGVLTYLNSSDCIGVVGYPTTPKMDIEITPEAAAATTNEQRTPFGYIPVEDQDLLGCVRMPLGLSAIVPSGPYDPVLLAEVLRHGFLDRVIDVCSPLRQDDPGRWLRVVPIVNYRITD